MRRSVAPLALLLQFVCRTAAAAADFPKSPVCFTNHRPDRSNRNRMVVVVLLLRQQKEISLASRIRRRTATSLSFSRSVKADTGRQCSQLTVDSRRRRTRHLLAKPNDNKVDVVKDAAVPDETTTENNNSRPIAIFLFAQFVLFIGVGAVIPAIPLYGAELGLSQAVNGIVISAPAVALLILARFAGNYTDTMGRKPALLFGMALIAVSDVGTAVATSVPPLLMARLGLGAGRCLAESGERGFLADVVATSEYRGRILALQQAVVAAGIILGAPLGGVVIELYGPRVSFLCVSAAAILALLLYTLLPETISYGNSDTRAAATSGKDGDSCDRDSTVRWRVLLQNAQWRGLAICQSGASFGFAAKLTSVPVLAAQLLPGGAIGSGALLSLAGLSSLLGAPVGGYLTDQFGARTTAVVSGCLSAVGLTLIPLVLLSSSIMDSGGNGEILHTIHTQVPGILSQLSTMEFSLPSIPGSSDAITVSGDAAAFAALVLLWSFGATAQGPALTALAQELAPSNAKATALALPRAAGDGTYIVAPFLLGAVADLGQRVHVVGLECALAGGAVLLGTIGVLVGSSKSAD